MSGLPEYNGYTNRPTWAVGLWLGNDQGLYNGSSSCVEGSETRRAAGTALRDFVEGYLEQGEQVNIGSGMAGDLLGWVLDLVDWEELADGYADALDPEERPDWADGAWPECDECGKRYDPADGETCRDCQEEAAIAADETGEA